MAKILVVDDDVHTVEMIVAYLTAQAHSVESANTGNDAKDMLSVSGYDIVILDWSLPDMTGIDILQWYRRKAQARVLMLTGKGAIHDRETGLDSGADDYLIKPFSMKELSARIRALLRRPVTATHELSAAGFTLSPGTQVVSTGDKDIQLTPREFALLEFLARHPDEVFKADVLVARVWPSDSEASPDVVRATVKRVRQKLSDAVIEYVPTAGYKIGR